LKGLRRDLPKLEPGQGWQSEQRCMHAERISAARCVRPQRREEHPAVLAVGYELEITGCWATVLR